MFVLILAGLTSVGTYIVGVRGLGLPRDGLRSAFGKACEAIGLTLIFFLLNLITGIIAILATRMFMGRFVSLYYLSDATLLVLALLQALTFQAWRAGSRRSHAPDVRKSDLFHPDR